MENQQNKEGENLLRIKEILFGEDLQQVDKRLQDLRADFDKSLKEVQAGLENTISDLRANQEKNAFMIQEVNQKKLKEIRSEINEQLASLKALFEDQNAANDQKLDTLKNSHLSKNELIGLLEEIIQKLR